MVNGNGTTGPASLDRVLASGLRLGVGPLPHSVNNSFVATRATHSLEELDLGGTKYPQWSAGELTNVKTENVKPLIKRTVSQPCHVPQSGKTQVLPPTLVKTKEDEFEEAEPSEDLEEDCEVKETDFKGISTILDDEDDSFIPFDPPLVSKFGPISRARLKEMNSMPVQVTAEESTKCTPVLSVTPLDRPYPVSALVPSIYKPKMTASVTIPTPDNLPYSMYSVWGGQDLMRHKIPEMVQQLEKSAIAAPTTNQRLALQLQSIELQISMKTGKTPKPIHELLQEADTRDVHLKERSFHPMEARTGVKNVFPGNYYVPEWK